jgi:hypothetical protein
MQNMDMTVQSNLRNGAAARWWTAGFLTVAYGVAQLDRNAINLLLPAIQSDLGLSDTQAGLLTGMAFAVLFSVASIPIGALADRMDRRWIIGLGLSAWSILTALCAVARSFGGLFAIRLGVGIGEASLAPCAYPILVEIFPKSFTARAIGLYVAGATAHHCGGAKAPEKNRPYRHIPDRRSCPALLRGRSLLCGSLYFIRLDAFDFHPGIRLYDRPGGRSSGGRTDFGGCCRRAAGGVAGR